MAKEIDKKQEEVVEVKFDPFTSGKSYTEMYRVAVLFNDTKMKKMIDTMKAESDKIASLGRSKGAYMPCRPRSIY